MNSNISIASCARLCELSISVSTGSKQDRDATSKVNVDNNTSQDNVARVTKNIFAHSEILPEIVKFAAQVRQEHSKLSLPWNDAGQRLIPNAMIQRHMETIGQYRDEFESMVQEFQDELPLLREHAEVCLGDLYDPMDYPSDDQIQSFIKSKFSFNLEYPPVPEAGGFLNGVLDDVKEDLNVMHQKGFDKKLQSATEDMWNRLAGCLQRLSTQLTDLTDEEVDAKQREVDEKAKAKGKKSRTVPASKRIHETLLPSALEICDALKAFNLTQDPVLEKKRRELKAIIDSYDVDTLKDKTDGAYYRHEMVEKVNEVKKSVDDITSKFSF